MYGTVGEIVLSSKVNVYRQNKCIYIFKIIGTELYFYRMLTQSLASPGDTAGMFVHPQYIHLLVFLLSKWQV
jgi:hypothetical protein